MTPKKEHLENLKKVVLQSNRAATWLERSLNRCSGIVINQIFSEHSQENFEHLEALTNRFARLADILIQKVFRSIDHLELEESGSVIDVIHRAAKRGIIDDEEELKACRELRNAIAHEYAEEALVTLFQNVLTLTPKLLSAHKKMQSYCQVKYKVS